MLITQAGMLGATESEHKNLIYLLSPRPPVNYRLDETPVSVLLHPSSPVYPIHPPSDIWMRRPLRSICVLTVDLLLDYICSTCNFKERNQRDLPHAVMLLTSLSFLCLFKFTLWTKKQGNLVEGVECGYLRRVSNVWKCGCKAKEKKQMYQEHRDSF